MPPKKTTAKKVKVAVKAKPAKKKAAPKKKVAKKAPKKAPKKKEDELEIISDELEDIPEDELDEDIVETDFGAKDSELDDAIDEELEGAELDEEELESVEGDEELEGAEVPDDEMEEPAPGATHAANTVPIEPPAKPPKKSKAAGAGRPPKPPMRLYRVIALTFVIIVAIALAVVVFLSLHEATVRVEPVSQEVSREFLVDVVNAPTEDSEIRGRVIAASMARTKSFEPSGEGVVETPAIARGVAVLKNDSGESQGLIRTTRLLTPDDVLIRIDDDVTVPANGEIEVEVYADQPGKSGNVGPTERLTIPGLSAARQEDVYATVVEPLTGGVVSTAVLAQEDIDQASAELVSEVAEDLKDVLREQAGENFSGEAFMNSIIEQSSDAAPGEEASSFELTLTVQVVGVFFDESTLAQVGERQLYEELTQGFAFVDIGADDMVFTVDKYDVEGEMANMRVMITGRAVPSTTSDKLAPERFTGMRADEIRQLLLDEGVAEDVSVEISPDFMNSAPRLQDKINVEIQ